MLRFLFIPLLIVISGLSAVGQNCSSNETPVVITFRTDGYASENRWELRDAFNNQLIASRNTFSNNQSHVNEVCIAGQRTLRFTLFDSYGDGLASGAFLRIQADGIQIYEAPGFGSETSHVFQVPLANHDASILNVSLTNTMAKGSHWIEGVIRNEGKMPVNAITISWQVNDGTIRHHILDNLNIPPFSNYAFTHPYGWGANAEGSYQFKCWISDLNGLSQDLNTENDTLSREINILDAQRVPLVEIFTNAGCPPCASQNPIFDVVHRSLKTLHSVIAYHTPGPGRDTMNLINPSDVSDAAQFYSIQGVPTAIVDGVTVGGTSSVTTNRIMNRINVPSEVMFSNVQVGIENDTLKASATITVNTNLLPGNYRIRAAVVEEEINFPTPPGSNGEKDFSMVFKKMLPFPAGVVLNNLGQGNTQNFEVAWPLSNVYNSDRLGVVFFVRNQGNKNILGSLYRNAKGEPDTSEPPIDTTSVALKHSIHRLHVYPNPNHGRELYLQFPMMGQYAEITLHDYMGKVLLRTAIDSQEAFVNQSLQLSEIPSGVYILSVSQNGVIYREKVMVR